MGGGRPAVGGGQGWVVRHKGGGGVVPMLVAGTKCGGGRGRRSAG